MLAPHVIEALLADLFRFELKGRGFDRKKRERGGEREEVRE